MKSAFFAHASDSLAGSFLTTSFFSPHLFPALFALFALFFLAFSAATLFSSANCSAVLPQFSFGAGAGVGVFSEILTPLG
ncbi:MAG: hypothetical protein WCJ81_07100 [bacterium]